MSDTITPIQIPCELNVPESSIDNETIESIKPKSGYKPPQSADDVQLQKKPHLQLDTKSRSMFDFPTKSHPENDDHTEPKEMANEEKISEITMVPPSTASYRTISGRRSTDTLEHIDPLASTTKQSSFDMQEISANANEMILNENRKHHDSEVQDEPPEERDDGEFDTLHMTGSGNSRLRIRSSIVSMFGRMGKTRRASNVSQNSNGAAGGGAEAKARGPPIRALPQIAATKILRAFSYVGKLDVERIVSRNNTSCRFLAQFTLVI